MCKRFPTAASVNHSYLELVSAVVAIFPAAFSSCLGLQWCYWKTATADFNGEKGCVPSFDNCLIDLILELLPVGERWLHCRSKALWVWLLIWFLSCQSEVTATSPVKTSLHFSSIWIPQWDAQCRIESRFLVVVLNSFPLKIDNFRWWCYLTMVCVGFDPLHPSIWQFL